MAVVVEMQNTGDSAVRTEVIAMIEHMLAERAGDWRVSIVGSQANDRWEMKVTGPNAFERSYTLEGESGRASGGSDSGHLGKDAAGEVIYAESSRWCGGARCAALC